MAKAKRVCFLYIAQHHQVWHSLSVAVAMVRLWPHIKVEIAATTPELLDYVSSLLSELGGADIALVLLPPAWLRRLGGDGAPPKAPMLIANARRLARYDAVITPERTTSLLRRLGVRHPLLVYTQHGAGDREGPFEPRLKLFDLVMAAGPKQRDRMLREGWVTPETCAMVGYPKLDLVDALPARDGPRFDKPGPIVLYNPHFHPELGSWSRWGRTVLDAFTKDSRYNLIFAPHIRLFETASSDERATFAAYAEHPRIHIDLGGPAAADMTYTQRADLYLGDVSSQVYEFLRTPKPCLFLNASGADWRGDPSYQHWLYGQVLDSADKLGDAVDQAFATHGDYRQAQIEGIAETFDVQNTPASERAAQAIVDKLERVA
ncbi:glycerophosphotransferase [Caulobacter sp. SL161]|uniref:glycerophosphotransferase n=1 Tax=Caulobacter sp. SL161 TaxID=2995156 RepID=UPI002274F3AF|nr:glycerophosphotransferase [Caulobacter sp. SL161]MCY1647166.1 glycerophosphotransferase [Caulobacter sp. SL161]